MPPLPDPGALDRRLRLLRLSSSLRVVTANAASGRGAYGRVDHTRWVDAAARLAGEVDADVWATQEVDRDLPRSGGLDQADVLLRALGDGWTGRFGAAVHGTPGSPEGVRGAAADDPRQGSYGVALATRLPVLAWRELHLDPSSARLPVALPPEAGRRFVWVPDEPRVALAATLDGPGGEVTAVTTHLSFAPTRAVRQLREVVRWARALPGPTVLLGDLNLPRGVAVWGSGLTAAEAGPTYPATAPRLQLDHVLVAPSCRLEDVATRAVADSDHLALTATVVLD